MKEILFPKNYIWVLAVKKGIVWILAWISTGFETGKKQQVAMETRSYDAGVCFTAEFRSGLDRAETSFFFFNPYLFFSGRCKKSVPCFFYCFCPKRMSRNRFSRLHLRNSSSFLSFNIRWLHRFKKRKTSDVAAA